MVGVTWLLSPASRRRNEAGTGFVCGLLWSAWTGCAAWIDSRARLVHHSYSLKWAAVEESFSCQAVVTPTLTNQADIDQIIKVSAATEIVAKL